MLLGYMISVSTAEMLMKNVQDKSPPGSYWNPLKTSDVGDFMMQHFSYRILLSACN